MDMGSKDGDNKAERRGGMGSTGSMGSMTVHSMGTMEEEVQEEEEGTPAKVRMEEGVNKNYL
jgi:hypothetical protein